MENNIGALWLNESKKGNRYMSGVIELDGKKHKIVVFKNKYKEEDKHPDYRIFASQPGGEQTDDFQDDSIPF
jgi:uncharacterized protein (DUF736 family)